MTLKRKTAKLALADGSLFTGLSFGAEGERAGEVVFNTAMSGYQEILTDPSYKGQIVTMTYPLIGNYGVNGEDVESAKPWVEGFVVKEASRVVSNHRATGSLQEYLAANGIVAIEEVDTRQLTRKLRTAGSINGVLSTVDLDDKRLLKKAQEVPNMVGLDLAKDVTSAKSAHWKEFLGSQAASVAPAGKEKKTWRVACVDYGIKFNIIRLLVESGCDVTVFPAGTTADEIRRFAPDGLFLSNGPGDPAAVTYAVQCIRELLRDNLPIFGICLGHQILNIALGAKAYKLKFGHHGANHPVKNLETGKVEVTSQNHGFAVDADSVVAAGGEVTHVNLNDQTVEGMRHRSLPLFSVQYHPESSPGPHDSRYLFDRFIALMNREG